MFVSCFLIKLLTLQNVREKQGYHAIDDTVGTANHSSESGAPSEYSWYIQ